MRHEYLHPRDEILEAMERIYRYRMTTTSGGNLSIREPNGDVWITPARVDKGGLRREDIVCVRAGGDVEGTRIPSSELPLHQAIYRARPDVCGIVHAHPVALVAFSLARAVPDTRLFHQAWQVCGEGGFAAYELPGSEALGKTVAATFQKGYDCVILENHGVVTAGADLQEAFRRFETFEFTGKTIIKARLSGREVRYLTDQQIELARGRVGTLPEFDREPPTSAEKELRLRLCEFVRRAYRQRLFISTQGSFSARLAGSSFLITPYRVDRGAIAPHDLVLVESGQSECGANPSRAANIHDAIYRAHPHVNAIINAYPVNATAFSVTGGEIDTRTIPESYIVVRHPGVAPYGLQFEDPEAIAAMLSTNRPALILENDGVLVTGGEVLEAFDRLEVLESTAEALINSRAVGELSPMPADVIRELEEVFLGIR
jgi:L-fuculose-phosphate aldolase